MKKVLLWLVCKFSILECKFIKWIQPGIKKQQTPEPNVLWVGVDI